MKKTYRIFFMVVLTLAMFVILGLRFDGSIEHLMQRRYNYIHDVSMGGVRFSYEMSTLWHYLRNMTSKYAFLNIAGNFGPFVMLAAVTHYVLPWKNMKIVLIYCVVVAAAIEGIQYICWLGAFDVADVFLRTVGALVGLGLVQAVHVFKISRD